MKLYKIKKSNIDNRGLVAARNIKKEKKLFTIKVKLLLKKKLKGIQNMIMKKLYIFLILIVDMILMETLNTILLD